MSTDRTSCSDKLFCHFIILFTFGKVIIFNNKHFGHKSLINVTVVKK